MTTIQEWISGRMQEILAKREQYLEAWVAETGLKPSECMLIETGARIGGERMVSVVAKSQEQLSAEMNWRIDEAYRAGFEEGQKQMEEARDAGARFGKILADIRLFPIMDAPSIPWSVIAPCEEQAKKNHDQTLERLAERGGLDAGEAVVVLQSKRLRFIPEEHDECVRLLAEIVRERHVQPLLNEAIRLERKGCAEIARERKESALRDARSNKGESMIEEVRVSVASEIERKILERP